MRRNLIWVTASLTLLACSEHSTPVETGGTTIAVDDNFFGPPQLVLGPGGTVTWAWHGSSVHNVTFDDGPASATQMRGQYQRQFATAGTYRYHCTIHGVAMSGTVEVR